MICVSPHRYCSGGAQELESRMLRKRARPVRGGVVGKGLSPDTAWGTECPGQSEKQRHLAGHLLYYTPILYRVDACMAISSMLCYGLVREGTECKHRYPRGCIHRRMATETTHEHNFFILSRQLRQKTDDDHGTNRSGESFY